MGGWKGTGLDEEGGPRLVVLRGYLKEGESTGVWDGTCCGVTPVLQHHEHFSV